MSRTDAQSSSLRRRPSRTIPATVLAVLVTAVGVALVWASVLKMANGRWPGWVGATHRWAAENSWESASIITISILVGLIGLLLLVTALAPGQPNAYLIELGEPSTVSRPDSSEFVMTRRAVAKLATAHAHLVDGVDSVSAAVGARGVKLNVATRSAHRQDIEQAVTDTVTRALTSAGLSRMPTVSTAARTRQT